MSFNRLQLQGKVENQPEIKQVGAQGFKVAKIFLQVMNSKNIVETFEIEAWNKTAEWIEANCERGSMVFIEGRLGVSTWGEGDNKKSKLKITAEKILFSGQQVEEITVSGYTAPARPQFQKTPDISANFDELPF